VSNPPADNPPPVHSLNYAPRPPRSRWLRTLTRWTLILAIALTCLACGKIAYRQAAILYWQRQCLNHPNTGQTINLASPAAAEPAAWTNYQNLYGPAPRNAIHFYYLYLGRMKRPDGVERLVFVWLLPLSSGPPKILVQMNYGVIQPATITRPAQMMPNADSRDLVIGVATPTSSPIMHGAIPDPADPTHFTISVTLIDGRTSTIDGFLDNNDVLHLDQRP
jgi:hypothetical protein